MRYGYHATTSGALDGVRAAGLRPGEDGRVWFATSIDYAMIWFGLDEEGRERGGALLRFRWPKDARPIEGTGLAEEYHVERAIPPKLLERHVGRGHPRRARGHGWRAILEEAPPVSATEERLLRCDRCGRLCFGWPGQRCSLARCGGLLRFPGETRWRRIGRA